MKQAYLAAEALPIVVDMDGTLLRADTLHEQLNKALFHDPGALVDFVRALPRGRAAAKSAVASRISLAVEHLPLNEPLVDWLGRQRDAGRRLHLCSAAHQSVVDAVARRLQLFDSFIGSTADRNLKGVAKADELERRFPGGFTYIGDSTADIPVWQRATSVGLVSGASKLSRMADGFGKIIEAHFVPERLGLRALARTLRTSHWSKNLLIFVPLLLAHQWGDLTALASTIAAFLITCLGTSSTYIINDLADVEADRAHWSKRKRAIAAGLLPVSVAMVLGPGGILASLLLAYLLSPFFALALLGYICLTLAYSFGLKRIPFLDTFVIGTLFTMRLVMGIELLQQSYSPWLITFSMFFFFSLALAKRHTEVIRAADNDTAVLSRRGYRHADSDLTLMFGVSSAMASLIIMVLYIVLEAANRDLYSRPAWLAAVPAVLANWLGRIWLLTHRGEMTDDPVSFAIRDRVSLGLGVLVVVSFLLAL